MGWGKFLCVVTGGGVTVCAPAIVAAARALAGSDIPSPVCGLGKSFVDNVFRDMVLPEIGSVLYCDLLIVEHSGIYIGNNTIVHLDGSGEIQQVSPDQFLNRLNGLNQAMSIYVSCNGTSAVGMKSIANRAKKMIGSSRDYNLILDNCHQFTAGCISNDFENPNNFLWMLKNEAETKLQANNWRVWEREYGTDV